ncbi:hypothetical protein KGF56_004738 [Candida oxycetoniae]|uniref:Uncharacterized protein n=1 Tax=Candida oxycetoniae TaxID=497107 RepID=A0AAI9WW91_9ASCO|nr:uncharacterized protein KGF56_004738 [Candida oxycetoniae]KAI3402497.2 hypothetical protein KGF56_004738 [Candida oxycetoniae]
MTLNQQTKPRRNTEPRTILPEFQFGGNLTPLSAVFSPVEETFCIYEEAIIPPLPDINNFNCKNSTSTHSKNSSISSTDSTVTSDSINEKLQTIERDQSLTFCDELRNVDDLLANEILDIIDKVDIKWDI